MIDLFEFLFKMIPGLVLLGILIKTIALISDSWLVILVMVIWHLWAWRKG